MQQTIPNFRRYCFIVALALAVLIGWGLFSADVLGVKHDEAWPMGVAVEGVQEIKNGDWSVFTPKDWMRYDYAGVFKDYILIPVFMFIPPSVVVMRAVWLGMAAFGLICFFLVTGRWFGWKAAVFSVVLLATNSTFIRATRAAAAREEIFMNIFLWLALFAFSKSRLGSCRRWWFITWLICGFAFWVKIVFGIYLFCFVLVALVFWRVLLRMLRDKLNILLGLAGFFVGSLPFWIGNFYRDFITFAIVFDSVGRASHQSFFHMLSVRCTDFGTMLLGQLSLDLSYPAVYDIPGLLLFIVALACILVWCVFGDFKGDRLKSVVALLIFWAGVFVFTFAPPAWTRGEQVIALISFPALVGGIFCARVFDTSGKAARCVLAVLLVSYILIQQFSLAEVDRKLSSNQVANYYDSAMRDCARYLEGNRIYEVVCNANVLHQFNAHTIGKVKQHIVWWCDIIVAHNWGYWQDYSDNEDYDQWWYWQDMVAANTQGGKSMYVLDMFPVKFWEKLSPHLEPHGYAFVNEKTFWTGFAPVRLFRVWKREDGLVLEGNTVDEL